VGVPRCRACLRLRNLFDLSWCLAEGNFDVRDKRLSQYLLVTFWIMSSSR
jgi:hypothetical protein